jgi:hypothetical protein
MKLTYCGPEIVPMGGIPLPEGWPSADHDEPDEALAEEKIASGNYKAADSHDEPDSGIYKTADPSEADVAAEEGIK